MPDRYAVIGNPVAHSRSPWIHARFAAQTSQALEYGTLLAPPDGFAATADEFRAQGGKGLNVTVPFKEAAYAFAETLSARARSARAVNTLLFADGIHGDNTDGCGLTRDLDINLRFPVVGRRVLLLGAGGAARGVLLPLLEAGPAALTVANRTPEKASQMVADLPETQRGLPRSCGFADLAGERFDLVINATSSGLSDAPLPLPARLFTRESLAYEMVYGRETAFMRLARAEGAHHVADGLGMLVEQAAESFFLWRGVRPSTAPVLAELRAG